MSLTSANTADLRGRGICGSPQIGRTDRVDLVPGLPPCGLTSAMIEQ
jgi:hypothetical protein